MDCLRRKHHKKKDHKKMRTPPAHVSPAHSQPSTMVSNLSLPKVSSTGLWMDTPGVYAVPSSQIYYPHPNGYNMRGINHPYPMARAVSEAIIPSPGLQYVQHRPQFGSQNNMYLLPVPQQRFYRSQPMAPVYELPASRGMEIYDYPFPVASGEAGRFRSKLLETRHTPDYYNDSSEFILRARVERAKSDAEKRERPKQHRKKEQSKQSSTSSKDNSNRHSSQVDVSSKENMNRSSKDNKIWLPSWLSENTNLNLSSRNSYGEQKTAVIDVHRSQGDTRLSANSIQTIDTTIQTKIRDTPVVPQTQLPLSDNKFDVSSSTPRSENAVSSATDSMKLLANNKTDDQKTQPSFTPLPVDRSDKKHTDENDNQLNIKRYAYEGSIYAAPKRNANDKDYDNPHIMLMKQMANERLRHSGSLTSQNEWSNPYEVVNSTQWINPYGIVDTTNNVKATTPSNSTYQEVKKITKVTTTEVIKAASVTNSRLSSQKISKTSDVVDGIELPDTLVAGKQHYVTPLGVVLPRPETSTTSVLEVKDTTAETKATVPVFEHHNNVLTPKPRINADDVSDDLNHDGNQVTTSAFQFLDNYLSDDEGTESLIESPSLSPRGHTAAQVY